MLIHLEKGELLFIEKDRVVCQTGDYEEQEMVLVGDTNNPIYPPDFPLYEYPAIYVKYGTFNKDII
jgi:hypothetical protein